MFMLPYNQIKLNYICLYGENNPVSFEVPEWYKASVSKGSQDQDLKIKVAVRMDKPMNMKHCG